MPINSTYVCDKTRTSSPPSERIPAGWAFLNVMGDPEKGEQATLVLSPKAITELEQWLGKKLFPPPPPEAKPAPAVAPPLATPLA